jgi:hypothetical protein
VVSRQNGKGGVLEVRVVAGVTLPQFGRSGSCGRRTPGRRRRTPTSGSRTSSCPIRSLKARLKGNGEPTRAASATATTRRSINLKDGSQILFFTRSRRRPWSVGDLLIIDEALDVTDSRAVGAAVHVADGGDPDRPARADDLRVDAAG